MAQAPLKGPPPPRPRRYFRAAEIRYLARKQSARDKSILLFRLRRKAVTLGEHGRLIPISDNAVRFIY